MRKLMITISMILVLSFIFAPVSAVDIKKPPDVGGTADESDSPDTTGVPDEDESEADDDNDDEPQEYDYVNSRNRDESYRGTLNSSNYLTTNDGIITSEIYSASYSFGARRERLYTFPSGDEYSIGQVTVSAGMDGSVTLDSFKYQGSMASARYYDPENKTWREQRLYSGTELYGGMYFITVDDAQFIVVLPQAYIPRDNQMLEWVSDYNGILKITRAGGAYQFDIIAPPASDGMRVEYMYILSDGELVDWTNQYAEHVWSGYQFYGGDNRWCYNGYYYVNPTTYYPSGENYYYRLPAAFISTKFINAGKVHTGAKEMGIAMLDVLRELQNEAGFFPSYAGSTWLKNDYNIDPGYYDTRFNTDLVKGYLDAYELYGVESFLEVVTNYGGFFAVHAIKNHTSVTGYDGWPGWLVDDYSHPDGNLKNHTSLNHQAAQITLMYRMYNATGIVLYRLMGEMMLRGMAFTTNQWIREDGNLKYALLDGQEVGADYPSLTYNDLYELQELLISMYGRYHSELTKLMDVKRAWMDANGITDYKK